MTILNFKTFVFSCLLSLLFSSCSSIDIFKENVELPIRHTYQSFVILNKEVDMDGFSAEFIDQQVQIRLEEVLVKEGLTYNKDTPELVIRYTSNEDPRKREVRNNYPSYPYYGYRAWDPWRYNPYGYNNQSNKNTTNYELVQVIVDFIDPKEDKLLMTLTGVTEITNPKSKSSKILKTTDKIIEFFIHEIDLENK